MSPKEAEDMIRRVGVEPTEKLVDQFIWAYYKGKAGSTDTPRIGFMCGTDFDIELVYQQDVKIFGSTESLIKNASCAKECGIIKVAITELETIEEGTLYKRWRSSAG